MSNFNRSPDEYALNNYNFPRISHTCTCLIGICSILFGLIEIVIAFKVTGLWRLIFSMIWLLFSSFLLYGWWKRKRAFYKPYIFLSAVFILFNCGISIQLAVRYLHNCDLPYDQNLHCSALATSIAYFLMAIIQCFSNCIVMADFGFLNQAKEEYLPNPSDF